jgi:hypothetical protein
MSGKSVVKSVVRLETKSLLKKWMEYIESGVIEVQTINTLKRLLSNAISTVSS